MILKWEHDRLKSIWQRLLDIRLILACFLLLGLVYSIVTPVLEALDEVWHVAVVHHIVHERALPVQPADPAHTGLWRQQGSQPPLYYLVGAALTFWVDTDDFPQMVQYNPHASGGHPEVDGNKNILLHDPDREAWPYGGATLAVHLLRLYSLALGALTVYGVYRIALYIWPAQQPWAALVAALVALNPQFLYIHAGVINDTLAIALCTWVLERLLWLLGQESPLERLGWWALLGLGSGLALLSKLSAGFLLVVVALAGIYVAWRDKAWLRLVQAGLLVGLTALAVSGWWFARNVRLYGELTGLSRFVPVAGARPGSFGLIDYFAELGGLELSFWGVFGWFSILADPLFYTLVRVLDYVAVAGLLWWIVRAWRESRWPERLIFERLAVLMAWFLILVAALYQWNTKVMGSQGRLMFPGVASVAVGLALGLKAWLPRRFQMTGLSVVAVMLLVAAVITPFRYIAPSYRYPPLVEAASVPEQVRIRYGDWGELVGYDLAARTLEPGEPLRLTLYWRALRPVHVDYDLYIHLRDAQGNSVGQLDTYPGRGMYQTSLWQLGEVRRDDYVIPVDSAEMDRPGLARIEVGFGQAGAGSPVPSYDPQGRAVTPVLTRFKVRGEQQAIAMGPNTPVFGGAVALSSWDVDAPLSPVSLERGQVLHMGLEWGVIARLDGDYRVFVHLVSDDALVPLAQADGEPQDGAYPTSWWEPGERLRDERQVFIPADLPAGDYRLLVGFYRPGDGQRLLLADGQDAFVLPLALQAR